MNQLECSLCLQAQPWLPSPNHFVCSYSSWYIPLSEFCFTTVSPTSFFVFFVIFVEFPHHSMSPLEIFSFVVMTHSRAHWNIYEAHISLFFVSFPHTTSLIPTQTHAYIQTPRPFSFFESFLESFWNFELLFPLRISSLLCSTLSQNFFKIFRETSGKFLLASFSSLLRSEIKKINTAAGSRRKS